MAHQPPSPQSPLPAWHFPFGPSTRYHRRERIESHHSRIKSAYTPSAPSLSTEERAHRRAQSSANAALSPPVSDRSSIRSPLSRHSSYNTTTSSSAHSSTYAMPVTPAKSRRRSLMQHDSPFSDYFTDESARSVHEDVPSSETQQLLLRILKLQSHLMRGETQSNQETVRIIDRKLSEMELELNGAHGQSQHDPSLADSGVFTEDQEEMANVQENSSMEKLTPTIADQVESPSMERSEYDVAKQDFETERRRLQSEMHKLLMTLTTLQAELRQRHAEVRNINARYRAQIEEREEQIEDLRMENEGLRSDLGFEYSELLFLKLQMKSLEVQLSEMDGRNASKGNDDNDEAKQRREKHQRKTKNRILAEIDGWRGDWKDVNARFRRRRSRFGPLSPERKKSSNSVLEEGDDSGPETREEDVDWRLETTNEWQGRMTSLTIRRVNYKSQPDDSDEDAETASGLGKRREIGANAKWEYAEQGTQTTSGGELDSGLLSSEDDGHNDYDHDCAVTSSSEPELSDDEDEPQTHKLESKSAWEELCESLANLAGMGEARF